MAIFGAFEKKKKATLFSGVSGFLSTVFGVSQARPGGPSTIEESLDVSVVFVAARVVAEGVAQTPLRLIEEDGAGNTRIAREHWAHRLLTRNLLHRLIDGKTTGPGLNTPAALALLHEPGANVERYDGLRRQPAGGRHAS